MKILISVLSADIYNDSGVWRTYDLDRYNSTSPNKESLRIPGAAVYINDAIAGENSVDVVTQGGFATAVSPSLASVMRGELVELGVPADAIKLEEETEATHTQLLKLQKMLLKGGYDQVVIISNEWHLPRIKAMIEHYAPLNNLRARNPVLVSAEEQLLKSDAQAWGPRIEAVRTNAEVLARKVLEQKGESQIIEGTYTFKDHKPKEQEGVVF